MVSQAKMNLMVLTHQLLKLVRTNRNNLQKRKERSQLNLMNQTLVQTQMIKNQKFQSSTTSHH
jgi:hypothetical protein